MKKILLLLFLVAGLNVYCQNISTDIPSPNKYQYYEEPVELAKSLINDTRIYWTPTGKGIITTQYAFVSKLVMNGGAYLLMESINLSYDLLQGGFIKVAGSVSTDLAFEMLETAVKSPKKMCKSIATATIQEGLNDYTSAYRIANDYLNTGQLSTNDAIEFLNKRWGLFKLASARVLWNASYNYDMDESTKNKVISEGIELFDNNVAKVPVLKFAQLFNQYYNIMESTRAGLPAYPPYIDYKKNMDEINRLRINERKKWKTNIKITFPNSYSGWNLDKEKVEIKWNSKVLDKTDKISMQLMQNGNKIQDLGSFANTGYYSNYSRFLNNVPDGEYYLYAYVPNKTDINGKIISSTSDKFNISGKKRVEFLNNGQTWHIGSKEIVEWNSNFTGMVDFNIDGTSMNIKGINNKKGFNKTFIDIPQNLQAGVYMLSSYSNGKYTGALTISIKEGNAKSSTNITNNSSGKVITPSYNSSIEKEKPINISWNFLTEGSIIIDLYNNGNKTKTLGLVPNNKSSCDYFEIPSYVNNGNTYSIKLTDSKNKNNFIKSDNFRIVDKQSVNTQYQQKNDKNYRPKRTSFAGRNINYIANLSFNSNRLTIRVYDHGREDGDIISLYLNGKPILQEYYLTNRKHSFTVYLESDETNDLFLFAINEGDIPPNTAALEISDGIKTEPIILNSNMQSCEGIMIKVK